MSDRIIEKIKLPSDIKKLDSKEIGQLTDEVREVIIETVSKNGGHLSSNLGAVELTIALHKCFCSPEDKIIFDVGHQAYAHKLLTGRYKEFNTLRKCDGISGFQNRDESEHDAFTEGHAGTSISQALGIAEANALKGSKAWTICIVGDGAFTNGMIFEAINNCSCRKVNMIIILNDNEMSISRNTGGIHHHFTKLRTSPRYLGFKRNLTNGLRKIPLIGKPIYNFLKRFKNSMKRLLVGSNLFDCFEIGYLGPVDGNDIKKVEILLEEAKKRENEVTLIHIKTKKGNGYEPAEKNPSMYHGVSAFDRNVPLEANNEDSFSSVFGELICEKAEKDDKICAITAAMADGTGLSKFAQNYPERFFDVGIAEEHAITFGAGLSSAGLKPVCALYSTFAQRSFDQLFHDVTVQKIPFTLVLDRAGFVPNDGITHQGIFDYPLFSILKNTEIYSVDTYEELEYCLDKSLNSKILSIIRYPKGKENNYIDLEYPLYGNGDIKYSNNIEKAKTVIFTYGKITAQAIKAISALENNKIGLVKMVKIYPLDIEKLKPFIKGKKNIYILEEGIKSGGFGEKLASLIKENNFDVNVKIHAIEEYVEHGSVNELYDKYHFNVEDIIKEIEKM